MKLKLKTHSGAKKRFRTTGSGKIKFRKSGARHLNYGKGRSRLRRLAESGYIDAGFAPRLQRLLPYGTP